MDTSAFKSSMNWENLKLKNLCDKQNNNDYKFELGCNILETQNKGSLICFNKNYLVGGNSQQTNKYFRCDEISLLENIISPIFEKNDGPRFRISNVGR